MADASLTGVNHELGRAVVELICLKRLNKTYIVYDFREVGESIRDPCTRVTVLLKWKLRPKHIGRSLNKGKVLAFEKRLGAGLPVKSLQIGFVVEELQLARRSDHMEIDHPFCRSREMRLNGV